MTARHDRHGWKWIGAPQSGVLGLFAAPQALDSNSHDPHLQKTPSSVPNGSLEATQSQASPQHPDDLLRALRLVLLGVEIVMSVAAGLLCVWCATIARSVSRLVVGSALAECMYTTVFAYGLLAFFATIFQQHDRVLLVRRLGLSWTPLSAVTVSVLFHSASLLSIGSNRSTTSTPTLSLRALLLAPIEEELFFRGLVVHLALHRLKGNAIASAIVSSAGFALVHFANARRLASLTALLIQIAWAGVVGFALALRYARKGSLLECILLHTLNNFFTAVASASSRNESSTLQLGILSITAYGLASIRELYFLRGHRRP